MLQYFTETLPHFLAYFAAAIALAVAFLLLYVVVTPHREFTLIREGNTAGANNVWAVEVIPGRTFAYELRRPNRFFRVEFDLTKPVAAPPAPWGASAR